MRDIRTSARRLAILLVAVFCAKALWMSGYSVSGRDLLSGAAKPDLLSRRSWLIKNVASEGFSAKRMPLFLPPILQQEWAIGTLSMTTTALANLAFLYPETREESRDAIARMIVRVLRDDLASYEKNSWGEDALSTLSGKKRAHRIPRASEPDARCLPCDRRGWQI